MFNCYYKGCPNRSAYQNIPIARDNGNIEYVGICFRHMHARADSTSITQDVAAHEQRYNEQLENKIEISAQLGTGTGIEESGEHSRNQ